MGTAFILLFAAVANADIMVKRGTDVELRFDQAVSSKTAKAGDRVKLHVAKDIVVDGKTVVKSGAAVAGVISQVDKKDRFGKNARIRLTLEPVKAVNGQMLTLQPREKGKMLQGSKTDKAALASGGGALLLGPVGLLGGYFIVGKSVNIKPGDKLVSEVAKDTTLKM
jgi:hypothetical protein